jgi:hypothetical protein
MLDLVLEPTKHLEYSLPLLRNLGILSGGDGAVDVVDGASLRERMCVCV